MGYRILFHMLPQARWYLTPLVISSREENQKDEIFFESLFTYKYPSEITPWAKQVLLKYIALST